MIAPSIVQEVRHLLARGDLSQRKIARITGISRGTVGAIAGGKRSDYEPSPPAVKDESPQPTGPPQRCPGCGGMVYLPCRLCHARALKAESSKPPIPTWLIYLEEPLGLDLRDEDRARYEEVHSRKMNAVTLETGRLGQRTGESLRIELDDLCGAFEGEEDLWELDPADLWDAFELDDDEPAIDYAGLPDFAALSEAADDEPFSENSA